MTSACVRYSRLLADLAWLPMKDNSPIRQQARLLRTRQVCPPKEVGKRRFPRTSIERIGGLTESDAVPQPLNVSGDTVGRHDERGVDGVDVTTCHRPTRMFDQAGDGCLGEPRAAARSSNRLEVSGGRTDRSQVVELL